jgi:hypothetical protein
VIVSERRFFAILAEQIADRGMEWNENKTVRVISVSRLFVFDDVVGTADCECDRSDSYAA